MGLASHRATVRQTGGEWRYHQNKRSNGRPVNGRAHYRKAHTAIETSRSPLSYPWARTMGTPFAATDHPPTPTHQEPRAARSTR